MKKSSNPTQTSANTIAPRTVATGAKGGGSERDAGSAARQYKKVPRKIPSVHCVTRSLEKLTMMRGENCIDARVSVINRMANTMDTTVMMEAAMPARMTWATCGSACEGIKIEIGSAFALEKPLTMEIKGRGLIEGVPKTIILNDSEVREALSEWVSTLMNAIRVGLERIPPELSADISDRGIVLTGGGALLKDLDRRIREETGLPVSIAGDPLCCVVLGTGKMLDDFKLLRKLSIESMAA